LRFSRRPFSRRPFSSETFWRWFELFLRSTERPSPWGHAPEPEASRRWAGPFSRRRFWRRPSREKRPVSKPDGCRDGAVPGAWRKPFFWPVWWSAWWRQMRSCAAHAGPPRISLQPRSPMRSCCSASPRRRRGEEWPGARALERWRAFALSDGAGRGRPAGAWVRLLAKPWLVSFWRIGVGLSVALPAVHCGAWRTAWQGRMAKPPLLGRRRL
jgi:hypothetical protein